MNISLCADNAIDLAIVMDTSQYEGTISQTSSTLGISYTSTADFANVKQFITALNSQYLSISATGTHEAIVTFSSTSPLPIPVSLNSYFTASELNNAVNSLTQATTSQNIYGDRSWASAFERVRDNVFCTRSCGERIEAYNVVLFITGGITTLRVNEAQALMNYLKTKPGGQSYVITIGVGTAQVAASSSNPPYTLSQNLTGYATCSSNYYFQTGSSLSTILQNVFAAITQQGNPGPIFEPNYNFVGVSSKF
jgi:hypothetical protein